MPEGGSPLAQTKTEIQAILSAAGIAPLKRFGQNFLIDGNLMGKLVAGAELRPDDVVLEVGPGTGALTERLLELAAHVVAVEIDRGLHEICRARFAGSPRVTLLHTDVLERKSVIAPVVLAALREHAARLGGRAVLVSNLPYQSATPLLMDLLVGEQRVSPLCFTVQAEVADRIVAAPGGREYGPLSVMAQAMAQIRRIARLPPQAFWPAPKVESAMLRMDVRESGLSPDAQNRLASLVHGCFQHRRKTLRSNLRELVADEVLEQLEHSRLVELEHRPEMLSVEQWLALAEFIGAQRQSE